MLIISHPRPEPGRVRFLDVEFIDGVATVESLHPVRRLALEQHGFTVAPAPHFTQDEVRVEFEPLPVAVEGDTTPKVSRPRKRKKA